MPIFIASPTDISQGDEAARRLQTTNDSRFAGEHGIIAVDEERWRLAQEYERRTWLEQGIHLTENRSEEHRAGFNTYADIPADLGSVLELGCGVFTVVRDMLIHGKTAHEITLVDPLAVVYQEQHPNCSYKDGQITSVDVTVIGLSIEDYAETPPAGFDTVILVNVLSHCLNAQVVLDTTYTALKPGGIIVFQETVHGFDPAEVYDAGHPLRPSQAFIDAFLARFTEVYRKGDYFVGRKAVGEWVELEAPPEVIQAIEAGIPVGMSRTLEPGYTDLGEKIHTPTTTDLLEEMAADPDVTVIEVEPPADEPEMLPAPKPKRGRKSK